MSSPYQINLKKWMTRVTQWIKSESDKKITIGLQTGYSIGSNLSITAAPYSRAVFALPVYATANYGKYQLTYYGIIGANATTVNFSNFCDGTTGNYIFSGTIDFYLIMLPV